MKTVDFTWCKVLFTMQKGVDVYCSTNKVIATLPDSLVELSMNSGTMSVVSEWKRECRSTDAEKLFFPFTKYSLWIFKTKAWQNENC